jgi:hypothetical protein
VSHDGSISGIVFLVSVVVVLCIILVIGSVGQDDDNVHTNYMALSVILASVKSHKNRNIILPLMSQC